MVLKQISGVNQDMTATIKKIKVVMMMDDDDDDNDG